MNIPAPFLTLYLKKCQGGESEGKDYLHLGDGSGRGGKRSRLESVRHGKVSPGPWGQEWSRSIVPWLDFVELTPDIALFIEV